MEETKKSETSKPLTDSLEELVRALEGVGDGVTRVPNKRVAVEPLSEEQTKPKVQGGVLVPPRASLLAAQPVVFPSGSLDVGDIAFIRADRRTASTWGKDIFEVDGKKFILVPEDEVLLTRRKPRYKVEALQETARDLMDIEAMAKQEAQRKNERKYMKPKSRWARFCAWFWRN